MGQSFYNTTGSTGEQLKLFEQQAQNQEARVRSAFQQVGWMTPSECWKQFFPECPITSVRRAMTNLTEEGWLVKTDLQKAGPWGKPEYVWRRKDLVDAP